MNKKQILEKIIEGDGDCCYSWVTIEVCKKCPFSKLAKKNDGTYLSCIEAIGAENLSKEEANKLYKEKAISLLFEEELLK